MVEGNQLLPGSVAINPRNSMEETVNSTGPSVMPSVAAAPAELSHPNDSIRVIQIEKQLKQIKLYAIIGGSVLVLVLIGIIAYIAVNFSALSSDVAVLND